MASSSNVNAAPPEYAAATVTSDWVVIPGGAGAAAGAAAGDEVGTAVGDDASGVSTMLGSVVTGTPSAFVALAAEPSSSSSFASAASEEEPSTATVAEITD